VAENTGIIIDPLFWEDLEELSSAKTVRILHANGGDFTPFCTILRNDKKGPQKAIP
jgi:hypothetical protein